jgi:Fe-S cluster assembly protein SufD
MIVAKQPPEFAPAFSMTPLPAGDKGQSALLRAEQALEQHLQHIPGFDAERRLSAMARLKTLGWPTSSQEPWKYVSLSKLAPLHAPNAFLTSSEPLPCPVLAHPEALDAFFVHSEAYRFVLVNGRMAPQYCVLPVHGPQVASLKWLLNTPDAADVLGNRWPMQAPSEDALNLLNTALWQDGVAIIARPGDIPDLPLEILLIHDTSTAETPVTMPRVLLWAQSGTRMNVLVQSVVLGSKEPAQNTTEATPALINGVLETWVDDNAHLDLVIAQSAQPRQLAASQFFSHVATQGQNSVLNVTNLMATQAAGATRNRLSLSQTASGASSDLAALTLPSAQAEHHVAFDVQHCKPQGQSTQNVRMIVRDQARAEFDGHITILQDAQQIEARQLCKSLLLSSEAKAYARPWLNIAADDVKCAHGATVGQLSEQELFYMTSRGISPDSARSILMSALVVDLLAHIQDEITRQYFTATLAL